MAADRAEHLCAAGIANRLDEAFLATSPAHLVPLCDPPRIEWAW
jgi:hypothetical protein